MKKKSNEVDIFELYAECISIGITPEYFYYKMQRDELTAIINKSNKIYKNERENTKILAYIFASVFSKKEIPYETFLDGDKINNTPTKKEKLDMKQHIKNIEKKLNNK